MLSELDQAEHAGNVAIELLGDSGDELAMPRR